MAYHLGKKRVAILTIIVVIILAVIGAVIMLCGRSAAYTPRTFAEAKSHAPKALPACVDTSKESSLNVSSAEQTSLFYAAVVGISDVPAGTPADMKIAAYSPTNASGTVMYGGTYGEFNFSTEKRNGNWELLTFEMCAA